MVDVNKMVNDMKGMYGTPDNSIRRRFACMDINRKNYNIHTYKYNTQKDID